MKKIYQDTLNRYYTIHLFLVAGMNEEANEYVHETECALCNKYYGLLNATGGINCEKCPIYEHTGHKSCRNTPYYKFKTLFTLKACEAEIAFLEKVLT